MVKPVIYFSFLSLLLIAVGCQSPSTQAMQYNDNIINYQIKIIDAIDSLENSFGSYDEYDMNRYQTLLNREVTTGIDYLNSLDSYHEDDQLLLSSKKLFNEYNSLAKQNYPTIIALLLKPDSAFTEADQQLLFDEQTLINDKINQIHQDFLEDQQAFGKRHNLIFTEEE